MNEKLVHLLGAVADGNWVRFSSGGYRLEFVRQTVTFQTSIISIPSGHRADGQRFSLCAWAISKPDGLWVKTHVQAVRIEFLPLIHMVFTGCYYNKTMLFSFFFSSPQ